MIKSFLTKQCQPKQLSFLGSKQWNFATSQHVSMFHSSTVMCAKKKDFYKVLGVQRNASKADIKQAYFAMAKKYHPDVNKEPSAGVKFKEVAEAYEVLEKAEKRELYDMYGHAGVDEDMGMDDDFGGNPFAGGGFHGGFGGGFNHAEAEDIFSMFEDAFGNHGGRNSRAGKDIQVPMKISFFEAVSGCQRNVEFEYMARAGRNSKKVKRSKRVKVDIPPGVSSGVALKMHRQGAPGTDGSIGDLYIEVEVKEDTFFKRQGLDIHVTVPISALQAMMGDVVPVLTLDGLVDMKIPPGTQPGGKLIMKNKGIPEMKKSGTSKK